MKKNTIQYQKEMTHCSVHDNNTILKEQDIIQLITYSFGRTKQQLWCVYTQVLTHSIWGTVDAGYEGARGKYI